MTYLGLGTKLYRDYIARDDRGSIALLEGNGVICNGFANITEQAEAIRDKGPRGDLDRARGVFFPLPIIIVYTFTYHKWLTEKPLALNASGPQAP